MAPGQGSLTGHKGSNSKTKPSPRSNYPAMPIINATGNKAYQNLVKVSVADILVWALVDSGATISIISNKTATTLKKYIVHSTTPDFAHVTGVGGETHKVLSKISLPFFIGQTRVTHDFHVISSQHDMILGLDFLCKNQVKLDFGLGQIIMDNKSTQLCKPDLITCLAKTMSTLTIPKYSEAIISVKCSKTIPDKTMLFKETNGHNDNLPQVTNTVTNVKGNQAVLRIVNNTDDVITIPPNTVIAYGQTIQSADIAQVEPCADTTAESAADSTTASTDTVNFEIDNPDISAMDKQLLKTFLTDSRKVFAKTKAELGRCSIVRHHIDTGTSKPTAQRFYRTSPDKRAAIDDIIDECLQLGLIEPSTSEWRAPVVLVKKPDNTWRLCCDYRKLNAITRPQFFPLPRLEDVWDAVGEANATVYSVLDFSCGFWQCEMASESKHKTAFVTPTGQYHWKVLPYGLVNSPVTFTRTVHHVLKNLLFKTCIAYVDDIICFSKNMSDHIRHLDQIFKRLNEAGLKLKPSKCHFAAKEVKYLGHIISAKGVKPNPEKVEIVSSFPVPKTAKEVRSFLGLTNYYKRFILDYSKIAAPLFKLLRKDLTFKWTDECQHAFQDLRQCLTTQPVIGFPDMKKPFILTTDASGSGIGYILSQEDGDKDVVICYGGRALRDAETRYSASEREMLAVKEGIKAYSPYLIDKRFTLITDHKPLKYLHKFQPETKRLCNMALAIQEYQYDVVYKKGKSNCNADTISRRPYDNTPKADNTQELTPQHIAATAEDSHTENTPCICAIEPCHLADLQTQCPEIGFLSRFHTSSTIPEDETQAKVCFKTQDQYVIQDGVLYHIYFPSTRRKPDHMIKQIVIPKARRNALLKQYHDQMLGGGHQGIDRTYSHLLMKYFWPRMYTDIVEYISTCDVCQRVKKSRSKPPPLTPMPVVPIFKRWHMDFLSLKATPDGFKYLLLFVDSTSRWCEAFPTKNQEAGTVATLLYENIITRYGVPDEVVSDLGRQFTSKLVRALCELCNIKQTFTSPYHPQTNAACERMNSFISQTIRAYNTEDQNDWPRIIPSVMMAYRSTPAIRSTELSPFQTLFGEDMQTPADVDLIPKTTLLPKFQDYLQNKISDLRLFRKVAEENIKIHQQEYKKDHDVHKHAVEPQIYEDQMVLMTSEAVPLGLVPKLHPPFKGPYKVVSKGPNYTYLLEDINGKLLPHAINGRRLKPYLKRQVDPEAQPGPTEDPVSSDEDDTSQAEILEDAAQLLDDDPPVQSTPGTSGDKQGSTQDDPVTDESEPKQQTNTSTGDVQDTLQQPDNSTQKEQSSVPTGDMSISTDRVHSIIKIVNSQGIKYYKVKLKDAKEKTWVFRESVPDDLLHKFHATKTMSGKARKKKKSQYFVSADAD